MQRIKTLFVLIIVLALSLYSAIYGYIREKRSKKKEEQGLQNS